MEKSRFRPGGGGTNIQAFNALTLKKAPSVERYLGAYALSTIMHRALLPVCV